MNLDVRPVGPAPAHGAGRPTDPRTSGCAANLVIRVLALSVICFIYTFPKAFTLISLGVGAHGWRVAAHFTFTPTSLTERKSLEDRQKNRPCGFVLSSPSWPIFSGHSS